MKILSSNKQTFYEVTLEKCSCPDYIYREKKDKNGKCKHMKAMEASLNNV
jgi:predicted nucleic acid-binding Zn finger protein